MKVLSHVSSNMVYIDPTKVAASVGTFEEEQQRQRRGESAYVDRIQCLVILKRGCGGAGGGSRTVTTKGRGGVTSSILDEDNARHLVAFLKKHYSIQRLCLKQCSLSTTDETVRILSDHFQSLPSSLSSSRMKSIEWSASRDMNCQVILSFLAQILGAKRQGTNTNNKSPVRELKLEFFHLAGCEKALGSLLLAGKTNLTQLEFVRCNFGGGDLFMTYDNISTQEEEEEVERSLSSRICRQWTATGLAQQTELQKVTFDSCLGLDDDHCACILEALAQSPAAAATPGNSNNTLQELHLVLARHTLKTKSMVALSALLRATNRPGSSFYRLGLGQEFYCWSVEQKQDFWEMLWKQNMSLQEIWVDYEDMMLFGPLMDTEILECCHRNQAIAAVHRLTLLLQTNNTSTTKKQPRNKSSNSVGLWPLVIERLATNQGVASGALTPVYMIVRSLFGNVMSSNNTTKTTTSPRK